MRGWLCWMCGVGWRLVLEREKQRLGAAAGLDPHGRAEMRDGGVYVI